MNIYQIIFDIVMFFSFAGLLLWNLRIRKHIEWVKKVCVDYFTHEIIKAKDDVCMDFEHKIKEQADLQKTMIQTVFDDVEKLKKGVIPDYEEACAAVRSVNDFNRGLSAIMNFDPMAAAKRMREEKSGKGAVNAE